MTELGIWFDATLQGLHHPGLILLTLVFITFLLEDVAIAAGVAFAAQGTIGWSESIAAVAFGIALGDLGLYGSGVALRKWDWFNRRFFRNDRSRLEHYAFTKLPTTVILARVIPGMRLFAYTYCGYVRVPFKPFLFWVCLAVLIWTVSLYALCLSIGEQIAKVFHMPLSIAVMLPMIVFALLAHWIGSRREKVSTTKLDALS